MISMEGWVSEPRKRGKNEVKEYHADPQFQISSWDRKAPEYVRTADYGNPKPISNDVLVSMRLTYAAHVLNNLVEVNRRKAGGVPVIANTRFTVAQLLAELGNGRSVINICRSFGLDKNTISSLLHALALQMDKPMAR